MTHFLLNLYCADTLKRSKLKPEATGRRASLARIGGSIFTPWSKAEDFTGLGNPGRGATRDGGGPLVRMQVGALPA